MPSETSRKHRVWIAFCIHFEGVNTFINQFFTVKPRQVNENNVRCLSPYSTEQRLLVTWLVGICRTNATQATDTNILLSVGHRNGVERSRLPRKISRESRMGLTIHLRALVMSLAFATSPVYIFLCLFPFVYSPRPHKCEHCLWKLDKFQKAVPSLQG